MVLTTLGTGTVSPMAHRASACHHVAAGDLTILFDCGAGSMLRMEQFGIDWYDVDAIALSHFHIDHWGELPALLFAMRYGRERPRERPLHIFGPGGLLNRMQGLAQVYGPWILHPEFPVRIDEMAPGHARDLGGGMLLGAFRTPHTDDSVAYSLSGKSGSLVYTGDTGPSEELGSWAREKGCDLLLAECSLPDDRPMTIHLTPGQAGQLATDAGARHLVLTHMYPPVEEIDAAAAASRCFDGRISVASDGDRFTIESKN